MPVSKKLAQRGLVELHIIGHHQEARCLRISRLVSRSYCVTTAALLINESKPFGNLRLCGWQSDGSRV